MKKVFLTSLVSVLVIGFMLSSGFQAVMAAEKDKYGGTIKVAMSKVPVCFGYPPGIRMSDQEIACGVLETLVKTNLNVVTEPNLATGWDVSPDGKAYTFKLRKGVKFHDGTDFNAQAAKYNLDIWINTPGAAFKTLTSVDVTDDYTVRLNFSEFDNLVLFEISREAWIASPTAMEKNGVKWAETHPVGTGPFKLKSYERNVNMKFERFNDYWQVGLPYLDQFSYEFIKDPMTQMAALKAGEVQAIVNMNYKHAKLLKEQGYSIYEYPGPDIVIFGDSKNPKSPWSNKKVREALDYAIDKEGISEMSYGAYKPLYQMVLPDHSFYDHDLKLRKYDPEKARKLLADAGYPDGIKITYIYMAQHFPESWVYMQSTMAKAGIDLKLQPIDRPHALKLQFEGGLNNSSTFQVLPMWPNPIYAVKNFLISTSRSAPDMARPSGFDELVNKLITARDLETQKAIFKQINKMAYDEVMYIPVDVEPRIAAFHKSIQNYEKFSFYGGPWVPRWAPMWLSKK